MGKRKPAKWSRDDKQDIELIRNDIYNKLDALWKEFDTQVQKWKTPLETFGKAYDNARKNVLATLKQESEARARAMGALFDALTLVCGRPLNWIGFSIAPFKDDTKLASSLADLFTGEIHEAATWGIGKSLDRTRESLSVEFPWPRLSEVEGEFATSVKSSFESQVTNIKENILKRLKEIAFNNESAENVFIETGSLESAKKYNTQVYEDLKKRWCETSFYYSHKPNLPNLKAMERIIERSMWVTWLKKNMRVVKAVSHGGSKPTFTPTPGTFSEPAIYDRLVHLGLMKASRNYKEKSAREAHRKSKEKGKYDPVLSHPGFITSLDEIRRFQREVRAHQFERIGDLFGGASKQAKPGRQPR